MFRKISFMSMLLAVLLSWGAMLNFAYSEDRTVTEVPSAALSEENNGAGTGIVTVPEAREIAALTPVSSRAPLPVKKAPDSALDTGTAYYP